MTIFLLYRLFSPSSAAAQRERALSTATRAVEHFTYSVMEALMIYLLWLLPTLVVASAIVSGRFNASSSALLGLLVAVPIAALTGPETFGVSQLSAALSRGLWIGTTIAPYIIGGLLIWQVAIHNKLGSPQMLAAGTTAKQ